MITAVYECCCLVFRLDSLDSQLLLLIPLYTVFKLDSLASKYIQCAAKGEVDTAVGKPVHDLEIANRVCATRVCARNWRPETQR